MVLCFVLLFVLISGYSAYPSGCECRINRMECYEMTKADVLHQNQIITTIVFHQSIVDVGIVVSHYPNVQIMQFDDSVVLNCPTTSSVKFVGGCRTSNTVDNRDKLDTGNCS